MQTSHRRPTINVSGIIICLLALPVFLIGSCQAQAPQEQEDLRSVVERLDADIALLNKLNRLSLSKKQAETLISIARTIQQGREAHQEKMDPLRVQLIPLLKEKIGYMMRDERIPDDLVVQIDNVRARLSALEDNSLAESLQNVNQARGVLSEPQLMIVTGGDQARQAAREMLMWIRELSAEDFHSEAMLNAEQLADPELDLDVNTVYDVFKTARDLTTEQYHARAPQLAAQLAPLFRTGTTDEDMILLELLTNERFIPVLQRRSEHLAGGGGAG